MSEVTIATTALVEQPTAGFLLIVGPSLGTSAISLWQECTQHVGNDFEVVGWDLPGHGASPAAKTPFSVTDLADAVRTIAQARGHDRRVVYAGVSLGGAVGLQLAVDPGPIASVAALGSAAQIGSPDAWHQRAELVRRDGTQALVSETPGRWFAPGFSESHPDVAQRLLSALSDADDESYALACEALADFDLTQDLAKAKLPVLFGVGSYDPVVTPTQVHAQAESMKAGRVSVLPTCSHLPPAEHPNDTAALLNDFYEEVTHR